MTKEKKNNDYFDDYKKGLKAYAELERTYQELHKMYVEQTNELLELQQKAGSMSSRRTSCWSFNRKLALFQESWTPSSVSWYELRKVDGIKTT